MNRLAKTFGINPVLSLVFTLGAWLYSAQSYGLLTGGTSIINTATVGYEDLDGTTYRDTDSITVTVHSISNLGLRVYSPGVDVDAGPSLSTGSDQTLDIVNIGDATDALNLVYVTDLDELITGRGTAGSMFGSESVGDDTTFADDGGTFSVSYLAGATALTVGAGWSARS
jgi:hypothetical protein